MIYPANTELVLCAWVASLPGFSSDMVGTQLPQNNESWAASGFVTVGPVIIGGQIGDQGALRNPTVQVSAWAVPGGTSTTSTSNKPPWGKAAQLLERIIAGCYAEGDNRRELDLGAKHRRAFCADVWPDESNGEPTRVTGEPPPIARYDVDISLLWAELPL